MERKENTKKMEASKIRSFLTYLVSSFVKQNSSFSLRLTIDQISSNEWIHRFYFIKD